MTRLRLRLDLWGVEEGRAISGHGVIANIYDVTDDQRKGRRKDRAGGELRNQVMPAGPMWEQDEFLDVELEAGQYLVEAVLPAGRVIREEVTLLEDESRDLRMYAGQSPREWLGWQFYVGNMQDDAETYYRRQPPITSFDLRTDLVSVLTPPPDEVFAPGSSAQGALVSRGYFLDVPTAAEINAAGTLSSFFPLEEPVPPATVTEPSAKPSKIEPPNQLYEFDTDQLQQLGASDSGSPEDYDTNRFHRHYLFIRGEGIPAQFSVLPVPWMLPDFGGEAQVEALVRSNVVDPTSSPGMDQGHRSAVTVRDRLFGSVLGYLGAGDLPAAATLVTRVREMLWGKRTNPLAAAAGAYVLMSVRAPGEPGQPVYWHKWVRNLMNWFEWLPDGAIQHGWLTLQLRKGDDYLVAARKALMEGYRRGLPFYSKRVSMLLDGLTWIADGGRAEDQPDEEVEEALRRVRRLALRTNARQPFTTVLLG